MTILPSNRWDFRKSEEVPPNEAPSVIIPPPPPPPPPTIVSGDLIDLGGGEFAGATNFSEFSVAAGLPSGITEYGIGSQSPSTLAIANDVIEGNYFSMDGHGDRPWGFGYDAFDGVMEQGEILVRIFSNFENDGRKGIGGAASMSGFVQFPGVADYDCWCGVLGPVSISAVRSSGLYIDDGGGSLPVDGLVQEPFQNGTWCWIRVRKSDASPDTSKDDWVITAWYGDVLDQPGPDGTAFDRPRTISGMAATGWSQGSGSAFAEQRIAFLSFSTDPTVTPPPLPDEVIGGP